MEFASLTIPLAIVEVAVNYAARESDHNEEEHDSEAGKQSFLCFGDVLRPVAVLFVRQLSD